MNLYYVIELSSGNYYNFKDYGSNVTRVFEARYPAERILNVLKKKHPDARIVPAQMEPIYFPNIHIFILGGGGALSRPIDTQEEFEHWYECKSNGANPNMPDWRPWIRPGKFLSSALDKLNGNHFLFDWMEAFAQSDDVPEFIRQADSLLIEIKHC